MGVDIVKLLILILKDRYKNWNIYLIICFCYNINLII